MALFITLLLTVPNLITRYFESEQVPTETKFPSFFAVVSFVTSSNDLMLKKNFLILEKKMLPCLRTCIVFTKVYEKDSKSSQMPPTRAMVERVSNLSKDNFLPHCYRDIRELSNGQICLCSRFEQMVSMLFASRMSIFAVFNKKNSGLSTLVQTLLFWL